MVDFGRDFDGLIFLGMLGVFQIGQARFLG